MGNGTSNNLPSLQNEYALTLSREIEGTGEPIVPAPDNYHVPPLHRCKTDPTIPRSCKFGVLRGYSLYNIG